VSDLPLKPIEASTLALGGLALVGKKSFHWAVSSLFKFDFQDDKELELNAS
jgi:hypothetical protein